MLEMETLFRSLSHQLYGSSEQHFAVCSLLLRFESNNRETFSKFLTEINSPNMDTHIRSLTLSGKWGTHIELYAAATYFQIPIYFVRTPSACDYKWEVINPIGPSTNFRYQLCPEIDTSKEDITVPDHFELLYRCDCHYDSIIMISGGVSTVKPTLQGSYLDCTDTVIG